MRKHIPLAHHKAKWMNYRTGLKDVYFRLETDGRVARVAIDIQHEDLEIRALFYEQFTELKRMLEESMEETLVWDEAYPLHNGLTVSRIYFEEQGHNFYLKENWPAIFQFFERYSVRFDAFWDDFRESFRALE